MNDFFSGAAGGATVAILIKAYDDYSKEMDKAGKSVKKLSKDAGAFNVSFAAVATTSIAVGTALGAMAVKAAEAADVQEQFNRATGIAGVYALKEMRKQTLGTVSDMELMSTITAASIRGIETKYLPALALFATQMKDAGIATGSTKDVIDDITVALATGRTGALARYGIDLKGVGDGFDDSTKKAMMFEEAVKQINVISSGMAKPTLDAADAVSQIRVEWERLQKEIGKTVGSATESSAGFFSGFLSGTTDILLKLKGSSKEYEDMLMQKQAWSDGEKKYAEDRIKYQDEINTKTSSELAITSQLLELDKQVKAGKSLSVIYLEKQLNELYPKLISGEMTTLEYALQRQSLEKQISEELKKQEEAMGRQASYYKSIGGGKFVTAKGKGVYEYDETAGGYRRTGNNTQPSGPQANDFLWRPGASSPVRFSESDTILGVKDTDKLGGNGVTVYIDSVQGLDADAVASSLMDKLSKSIMI